MGFLLLKERKINKIYCHAPKSLTINVSLTINGDFFFKLLEVIVSNGCCLHKLAVRKYIIYIQKRCCTHGKSLEKCGVFFPSSLFLGFSYLKEEKVYLFLYAGILRVQQGC